MPGSACSPRCVRARGRQGLRGSRGVVEYRLEEIPQGETGERRESTFSQPSSRGLCVRAGVGVCACVCVCVAIGVRAKLPRATPANPSINSAPASPSRSPSKPPTSTLHVARHTSCTRFTQKGVCGGWRVSGRGLRELGLRLAQQAWSAPPRPCRSLRAVRGARVVRVRELLEKVTHFTNKPKKNGGCRVRGRGLCSLGLRLAQEAWFAPPRPCQSLRAVRGARVVKVTHFTHENTRNIYI